MSARDCIMSRAAPVFRHRLSAVSALFFVLCVCSTAAHSQTRIKDIAKVMGLENRRIDGIGLVTGLKGTGDGTQIIQTIQAVANVLKNYGIDVDRNRMRQRNIAMVSVYANLPPFTKRGSTIDVVVATMGDARSLEGGVLIQAPLYDISGNLVAWAQGPVSIGGLNAQGVGRENFSTTGRVINGALIQADFEQSFKREKEIVLNLQQPDFTTAFRVAEAINEEFGRDTAKPTDPATIKVAVLDSYGDRYVEFISKVEQLRVDTDMPAKVVISERTGTVIAGKDVKLSEVLISHGDLTIAIQPAAGAPAQQAAQGAVVVLDSRAGSSVQNLADALNALQVTPRELIAIFQALKAQGALNADLEII